MSGRADIIALAQTLGLATTDAVLLDKYYEEALIDLADASDVSLETVMMPVTAGQPRYNYQIDPGGDARSVRCIACFFGSRELTRTTLQSLEATDHDWQATLGTPVMYLEEHEDDMTVRLYPTPNATSAAAVMAPDPWGLDYPTDRLVVLLSDRNDTSPPWLDYPLALAILARELTHQSAHRDSPYAQIVAKLGQQARMMGGLP